MWVAGCDLRYGQEALSLEVKMLLLSERFQIRLLVALLTDGDWVIRLRVGFWSDCCPKCRPGRWQVGSSTLLEKTLCI